MNLALIFDCGLSRSLTLYGIEFAGNADAGAGSGSEFQMGRGEASVELHLGLSLDTETLMHLKACHSQPLHPIIDLLKKYQSSENY